MKKYIIIVLLFMISAIHIYAKQTIVLTIYPNIHMIDEKKRGKLLIKNLKPGTRYYVKMVGHAWLSDQTGRYADPVHGVMIYYREFKNGKSQDSYRVIKHRERFVFTTAKTHPIFTAFIMEIYSKRNNRGKFVITLREL